MSRRRLQQHLADRPLWRRNRLRPLWTGTSTLGNSAIYQSGGKVGIGTTSPGANLDLAGKILRSEGSGTSGGYSFENDGAYDTGMFSPSDRVLAFYDNGTNSIYINPSGDVGIATSAPAYTLDVNGPIKTRSASGIIFSDGTSQGTTANWSGTADYLTKSDPTFSGAVKLGPSQVYDNGTNVGIGTTAPSQKLEVNGTGIFRSTLYVNNNGTSGGSGATGAIVLDDGTISKAYGSGFTMNSSLTLIAGTGNLSFALEVHWGWPMVVFCPKQRGFPRGGTR